VDEAGSSPGSFVPILPVDVGGASSGVVWVCAAVDVPLSPLAAVLVSSAEVVSLVAVVVEVAPAASPSPVVVVSGACDSTFPAVEALEAAIVEGCVGGFPTERCVSVAPESSVVVKRATTLSPAPAVKAPPRKRPASASIVPIARSSRLARCGPLLSPFLEFALGSISRSG
jgi:hypothetical protein